MVTPTPLTSSRSLQYHPFHTSATHFILIPAATAALGPSSLLGWLAIQAAIWLMDCAKLTCCCATCEFEERGCVHTLKGRCFSTQQDTTSVHQDMHYIILPITIGIRVLVQGRIQHLKVFVV